MPRQKTPFKYILGMGALSLMICVSQTYGEKVICPVISTQKYELFSKGQEEFTDENHHI